MSKILENQIQKAGLVLSKPLSMAEISAMQPGEIIQEGLIINVDGNSVCHSVRLAHDLGMQHKNLLAHIRKHANDASLFSLNFQQCNYQDASGRQLPAYLLSKDAFVFVTLSKRGPQATQFRIRYIQAFNELSTQLHKVNDVDLDEQRLIALRDTAQFAIEAHRRNKTLGAAVEVLTEQVDTLKSDLSELRSLYEASGKDLKLASSSDNWHGGPYTVDDLRKRGFMSTDDIPRRKPQYFQDPDTGQLALYSEILDFVREQMHITRSTHRNPMLRVDAIRNGWCGVFAVYCKANTAKQPQTEDTIAAGAVVVSDPADKHVRPMVFFTPDGVEEIIKRWKKRSTTTADTLV